MIIEKAAVNANNYRKKEYYYESARDGMLDLLRNMVKTNLIDTIFLPGYIGWSPKEGSGIFDPLNKIENLAIHYYKMTPELNINCNDLQDKIKQLKTNSFAVLVVNYFGFIDPEIKVIANIVKEHSGWLIEDNAHGFFTYQYTEESYSDATFFSLHKMFPFKRGGSLLINSRILESFNYCGDDLNSTNYNPWQFDIKRIALARRSNYFALQDMMNEIKGVAEYFVPLKKEELAIGTVPQTFPIRILSGDRSKIYELMNEAGYGVVSLYHTLIEPLRSSEYQASLDLSRCILNLPVHQDVDKDRCGKMIQLLVEFCNRTSQS